MRSNGSAFTNSMFVVSLWWESTVYLPTSWLWIQPCNLLQSMKWRRNNGIPVPSPGLNKLLLAVCTCIITWSKMSLGQPAGSRKRVIDTWNTAEAPQLSPASIAQPLLTPKTCKLKKCLLVIWHWEFVVVVVAGFIQQHLIARSAPNFHTQIQRNNQVSVDTAAPNSNNQIKTCSCYLQKRYFLHD